MMLAIFLQEYVRPQFPDCVRRQHGSEARGRIYPSGGRGAWRRRGGEGGRGGLPACLGRLGIAVAARWGGRGAAEGEGQEEKGCAERVRGGPCAGTGFNSAARIKCHPPQHMWSQPPYRSQGMDGWEDLYVARSLSPIPQLISTNPPASN